MAASEASSVAPQVPDFPSDVFDNLGGMMNEMFMAVWPMFGVLIAAVAGVWLLQWLFTVLMSTICPKDDRSELWAEFHAAHKPKASTYSDFDTYVADMKAWEEEEMPDDDDDDDDDDD